MATSAADPTARFFDELGSRGHEPLLRKATGTARLEIVDGRRTRRWFVSVNKGDVSVSRSSDGSPTCVIRVEKPLFDKIAAGKENAVAAVLRGDLAIAGDWRFLVWLQRLFPGPRTRKRTTAAGWARRRT